MSEMVYVLAASYDDADAAMSAYGAIEAAYKHVGTSHEIDVTVVAKDADGKVEIVKRHDSPTRDRTAPERVGITKERRVQHVEGAFEHPRLLTPRIAVQVAKASGRV